MKKKKQRTVGIKQAIRKVEFKTNRAIVQNAQDVILFLNTTMNLNHWAYSRVRTAILCNI
jgi:hypothetical protein